MKRAFSVDPSSSSGTEELTAIWFGPPNVRAP